ncbi:MAG: hypothetical protein NVV74_21415 [Magnetospirillum sp.]|nr:hypothetical protein [Magnetospirillum sp.]
MKVDGLLKPGGPTITSLKKAAGGLLGGFTPPTPDDVDEHQSRVSQGEPGLLNIRLARLSLPLPKQPTELDKQSLAFNTDSARALSGSRVDGSVPTIYTDFVKQAGADAHPTVLDLIDQINTSSGRDRADRVLHGIVGQLPADQAKALLGGDPPASRPLGVKVAELSNDDGVPLFHNTTDETPQVRLAAADTDTTTDAAPAPADNGPGEQVAFAPAIAAGAAALGGATAAILGKQLPEAMEKTRKWWENRENEQAGQQTTTVDPEAGKPTVLTGPDPSKPQAQPGTPPSQPSPPMPPVPPSVQQNPPGPNVESFPAEQPKKPEPVEIKKCRPHRSR